MRIWPFCLVVDYLKTRRERIKKEEEKNAWAQLAYKARIVNRDMRENPQNYLEEECPFIWGDN